MDVLLLIFFNIFHYRNRVFLSTLFSKLFSRLYCHKKCRKKVLKTIAFFVELYIKEVWVNLVLIVWQCRKYSKMLILKRSSHRVSRTYSHRYAFSMFSVLAIGICSTYAIFHHPTYIGTTFNHDLKLYHHQGKEETFWNVDTLCSYVIEVLSMCILIPYDLNSIYDVTIWKIF